MGMTEKELEHWEEHGRDMNGNTVPIAVMLKKMQTVIRENEIIMDESHQVDLSKLVLDDELRPPNPEIQ